MLRRIIVELEITIGKDKKRRPVSVGKGGALSGMSKGCSPSGILFSVRITGESVSVKDAVFWPWLPSPKSSANLVISSGAPAIKVRV